MTQTVNSPSLIGTSTSLSSNSNPSLAGQTVTFTAVVSPSAATGTVTFRDGAATLGSATLNGGVASYSTSTLSGGAHSITAFYNGNAGYNSSTSNAVTQTVNKLNTTTSISSNLNPSAAGQSVTFTALISANTATGSVTFYDGAAVLGVRTATNGVATLSTSALSAGSHGIRAVYAGDAKFNGSSSSTITQTVNSQTGDTTNPIPRIISPANGSAVSQGWVTISASATDNVGVTRMELYIQGALVATSTNGSLSYRWSTRKLTGTQTLTVRALDSAGNLGTASAVVTIASGGKGGKP